MPQRSDDGAYLVLWALLVTAVFAVAALVLDIAALRQDRRTDRLAADLASTAAVSSLDATDPSTFVTACQSAWAYVRVNLPSDTGAATTPPCAATFPATQPCTTAMGARTATGTVGDLRVEITHPVPAASTLMRAETPGGDRAQAANLSADGSSCERVAVRLVRTRTFSFGGVVGQPGGGTDVHSVARAASVPTTEVPGVVALHPTDCSTVTAPEQADLLVEGVTGQSGIIEVDSDGSTACPPGAHVIVADPGRIRANGTTPPPLIRSFTLAGPNPTRAYDPGDVASARLLPEPSPSIARFGRGPVEYRYNCSAVVACTGSPLIDQLRTELGGSGGAAPSGFNTFSGCSAPPDTVLDGDWYIDCPTTFDINARFALRRGRLVFRNEVHILDAGCLSVNSTKCLPPGDPLGVSPEDNVVFVRGGNLKKEPGGDLALNRTFVYLDGTTDSAGTVDLSPDESGAKELSWTAPLAGPFEDLALWTETTGFNAMGGHGAFKLEGTFYAPDGRVRLRGRTGGSVADAQFIAGKVQVTGTQPFTVAPITGRALARTVRQVRLIR